MCNQELGLLVRMQRYLCGRALLCRIPSLGIQRTGVGPHFEIELFASIRISLDTSSLNKRATHALSDPMSRDHDQDPILTRVISQTFGNLHTDE